MKEEREEQWVARSCEVLMIICSVEAGTYVRIVIEAMPAEFFMYLFLLFHF